MGSVSKPGWDEYKNVAVFCPVRNGLRIEKNNNSEKSIENQTG
jgi:hypothetical protein